MDLRILIGLMCFIFSKTVTLVLKDSVVFNKISEIHTSRSFWKLTLVEDLENYTPKLDLVNRQLIRLFDELKTLRSKVKNGGETKWANSYDRLLVDYQDLRSDFDELSNEFDELRKLEDNPNLRKKRSLLPFIGRLTSFLFGTVSESDLSTVKKNLKTLANNQQELTHVLSESLTMLNISRKEIGENRNKLNEAIAAIRELNLDLKTIQANSNTKILELEQVVRVYLQSRAAFNRAKTNVAMLFRHLRTFQIQLNRLSLGRLSPIVIKPHTLVKILKSIKNKLSPPLTLVREPEVNLWYFYKTLKVATIIHDQKLIVVIDIPLVNTNSKLELFQIHNLPFPGQKEFRGATAKYDIESTGLAINHGRNEYILLNKEEFAICTSHLDSFCELNKVRYMISAKMHCVSSIFMSDSKSIKKNCKVQIFPNSLLPRPQYLRDGVWAISTNETFRLTVSCEVTSERSVIVKPPLTLFQLKESCFATSNYFIIPARNLFKSKTNIERTEPRIRDLNIKNISLWQPITRVVSKDLSVKVPKKLESLKSYPMSRLVEELNHVRNNPIIEDQSESWYWYVILSIIAVICSVVTPFLLYKWKDILKNKKERIDIIELEPSVKGNDPIKTELSLK